MSDTTTTQTSADQTPTPPRKRHGVRNTVLVLLALSAIGGIASAASGGSHPATATPAPPASSAPASPAKPAQPATASGYLTAHGYTVVQHFSRAEWLAKLTPGTAYAKYLAAGSDVAADGLKGSKVEFAIKVSDPAAAASVATSSMTLDGTYLVSSMTMPTTTPSRRARPRPRRPPPPRPRPRRAPRPHPLGPPCPSSRRWTRPSPTWTWAQGSAAPG